MTDPAPHTLSETRPNATGGGGGCHEVAGDAPELDARLIPHAIRHGAILGALAQVAPGQAMVLIAPHDPKPLLAQIAEREGDAVEVSYLKRGPEAWKLQLRRTR